jgi:biotin carboxyl carrier protein
MRPWSIRNSKMKTPMAATTKINSKVMAHHTTELAPPNAGWRSPCPSALSSIATRVRRNAALSLAGFGDGAGRSELLAMPRPYAVRASVAGPVRYRLKLGNYVNPGTLLARVGETEVRSPAPGEVRGLEHKEDDAVAPGDALAGLSADKNHVWEALRARYVVGQAEDLEDVRRFTRPVPGLPDSARPADGPPRAGDSSARKVADCGESHAIHAIVVCRARR